MQKYNDMDLTGCSITELISLYSKTIKELKKRGVLRTKNVIGELGEYLVYEYYEKSATLPNLTIVPIGTKNINAISQDGDRYSIKSTTGNVTGVFYGLEPIGSVKEDKPLFEYVIICKLDDNCELEGIYQISWEIFQKHKKWHSRMKAWNITITKALKEDSTIIYDRNKLKRDIMGNIPADDLNKKKDNESLDADVACTSTTSWNKTEKINHKLVRNKVVEHVQTILNCDFKRLSQARYVSSDNTTALFILSSSYSQKNQEYWYSINDENIPWLKLFPNCYIAFALGGYEQLLLFPFVAFVGMLDGCLRTEENPAINKKAHYHISFSVKGDKVFFKKKLPKKEKAFIDVSDYLK